MHASYIALLFVKHMVSTHGWCVVFDIGYYTLPNWYWIVIFHIKYSLSKSIMPYLLLFLVAWLHVPSHTDHVDQCLYIIIGKVGSGPHDKPAHFSYFSLLPSQTPSPPTHFLVFLRWEQSLQPSHEAHVALHGGNGPHSPIIVSLPSQCPRTHTRLRILMALSPHVLIQFDHSDHSDHLLQLFLWHGRLWMDFSPPSGLFRSLLEWTPTPHVTEQPPHEDHKTENIFVHDHTFPLRYNIPGHCELGHVSVLVISPIHPGLPGLPKLHTLYARRIPLPHVDEHTDHVVHSVQYGQPSVCWQAWKIYRNIILITYLKKKTMNHSIYKIHVYPPQFQLHFLYIWTD